LTAESPEPSRQPLWSGHALLVLPPGAEAASDPARITIRIDPAGAFGDGGHPTTRLCLKAIERFFPGPKKVFDVGTGTGILAVAAAKLGAADVLGVDIDPAAVSAAADNVRTNGVADRVRIRAGSLAAVLADAAANGAAAFVAANILSNVIEEMLSAGLAGAVGPGGYLVVSGFLTAQTAAVRARLRMAGLETVAQEREGEWALLAARR
jgi:ribosomal protein L11 methyltransferase